MAVYIRQICCLKNYSLKWKLIRIWMVGIFHAHNNTHQIHCSTESDPHSHCLHLHIHIAWIFISKLSTVQHRVQCILKGQFDYQPVSVHQKMCAHTYGLHKWFLPLKNQLAINHVTDSSLSWLWHCCTYLNLNSFAHSHIWRFINDVTLTNRWSFFASMHFCSVYSW